ncbi:hypothetical protein EsH8_IV_000090 [Colletotrichum jinshuiense]
MTEDYGIPCHNCTAKFIHPVAEPVRSRSHPNENHYAAKRAANGYAESLCDFLIMAMTSTAPDILNRQHQHVFRVSKMETACRFDKQHFHNGASCDCSETNTEPELHNMSAAMRRLVSRAYLFPYQGLWPDTRPALQRTYWPDALFNTERTWDDPNSNHRPLYDHQVARHLQQPNLSILDHIGNPMMHGDAPVTVIPFIKEYWDPSTRFDRLKQHGQLLLDSIGGLEGWLQRYTAAFGHYGNIHRDRVRQEYTLRLFLTTMVTHQLAIDPGITYERALSIADVFARIWDPNPETIRNDPVVGVPLADAMIYLIVSARQSLMWNPSYQFGGQIFSRDVKFLYSKYCLERNRDMRLEDERTREAAIEDTVTPLTALEVAALPPDQMECSLCMDDMSNPLEPHAAVRLKCPSGHLVGMNCWMEFWRKKRQVHMVQEDGILCHSCGHFKLGEWKAPVHRINLFANDVLTDV